MTVVERGTLAFSLAERARPNVSAFRHVLVEERVPLIQPKLSLGRAQSVLEQD